MSIETHLLFCIANIRIFFGQSVKVLVLKSWTHALFHALDLFFFISFMLRCLHSSKQTFNHYAELIPTSSEFAYFLFLRGIGPLVDLF